MQEATLDPAAAIEALLAAPAGTARPRARLLNPNAPPADPSIVPSLATDTRARRPGVRTLLVGLDYALQNDHRLGSAGVVTKDGEPKRAGYLMTGGEDRKVRFWDLDQIEKSTIVSGLDLEEERPVFTYALHLSLFGSSLTPRIYQRPHEYDPTEPVPRVARSDAHSTLFVEISHGLQCSRSRPSDPPLVPDRGFAAAAGSVPPRGNNRAGSH